MLGLYPFPTATTAAVCSANSTTTQSVPYFGSGRMQNLGRRCCRANIKSSAAVVLTIEVRAKVGKYFVKNYDFFAGVIFEGVLRK
jgi:hypothetical protein